MRSGNIALFRLKYRLPTWEEREIPCHLTHSIPNSGLKSNQIKMGTFHRLS